MSAPIVIGADPHGAPVTMDIEELLASRLLVQGNSGSGKSHLLRRLLEESAGIVQQVVIDPEGDFVTLADAFGHTVIDGSAYSGPEIARLGSRIRKHRASVVLALDGLEIDAQMRCAALFLNALFDAPREEWFPALVVVDEAQMFAPAAAGDVAEDARRVSLAAMTNLMCRGRKRGLAGVIATQRLAKLAKNVAAEASNFLMGRTFLDIDMVRAADLLGMERRQAEQIRDLQRGHFLGLGPAISRRPVPVRIGAVQTGSRAVSHALAPPPVATAEDMHALLHAGWEEEAAEASRAQPALPLAHAPDAEELIERIAQGPDAGPDAPPPRPLDLFDNNPAPVVAQVLVEMAQEPDCTYRATADLFQDFTVRCRMQRVLPGLDMVQFRRRFALAIAGVDDAQEAGWAAILDLARGISEDQLAPFLVLARAAYDGAPCPDDDMLARIYGTHSPGRIRRLIENFEKEGLIVTRTDFGGRRQVTVPLLGVSTAMVEA